MRCWVLFQNVPGFDGMCSGTQIIYICGVRARVVVGVFFVNQSMDIKAITVTCMVSMCRL